MFQPRIPKLSPNGRRGRTLSYNLCQVLRALTPAVLALTFATVAHAQGSMDFSGATTLMGTFKTVAVCTDTDCPIHNPHVVAQRAADPPPTMPPASDAETVEEAEAREAKHEQRMAEYQAEQSRKEEERKAEFERQRNELEAEQNRRDKQRKARLATLERILVNAPAMFTAEQLRVFLSALINLDPFDFADDVAAFYVGEDENNEQTAEEVLESVLALLPDEKLTAFALRVAFTGHTDIPREDDVDFLAHAESVFVSQKPKKLAEAKKLQPVRSEAKPKFKKETSPKAKLAA